MLVKVIKADNIATVRLEGRFDFDTHREFRSTVEAVLQDPASTLVRIDLGGVDYLDSSALGMLLMLRDKASATNRKVALANSRGNVRQVLEIANFGKLFAIE